MADSTARGRFVWHELITPNGTGAREFYKSTLGWNTQAWEHDKSYSMFVAPSGPLGASIESRDGVPQWVPYVGTNEVEATVQEATRRGASVKTPATSIANGGTYAILTDPQGATFGVHRGPASETAYQVAAPKYGEFSWHELATTEQPGVPFELYSSLFGWEKISEFDMGSAGIYLIFGLNGVQLGGMFNKGEMGKPGPGYWVSYVRVKNVNDTVDRVKGARGSLLNGPMEVPGGDWIAQLADPHGAFFAVHVLAVDVKGAAAPAAKSAAAPATKKAAETKPAKKKAAKKVTKKAGKKKAAKKKAAKKVAKKKGGKKKQAKGKRPAPKKMKAAKARKKKAKRR